MPLTEASKSKVRLASLSATTAAAAESLWSKSKKSSKRRQKSLAVPDNNSLEVSSSNPSTNPVIKTSLNQPLPPAPLVVQQPQDRQEFRRKFLEGLQFYCENSSLILNSDLPADLIEFVTSHGFSVESLGIILELKKSSSAFSAYVDKKPAGESSSAALGVTSPTDREARDQNFSEISRRLLQHWMSADSCAEAFVSLSLGEEIPGLIAECASFQRILFAVPDNFRLNGEDFLSFLLGQLLLAVHTLVYGLSNQTSVAQAQTTEYQSSNGELEPPTIRTQVLATFLDRIFMRHFSDVEHFHNSIADRYAKNPFQDFIIGLAKLCSENVIGNRLVSKMFLHLGSHSAAKLAKITFASRKSETKSVAPTILWPAFEFLERNSQWKFILQTLPVKTVTKSKMFWITWAEYIEKESSSFNEIWHKNVEHWIILNKSNLVDEHSLYSTSLAITALAKQIKNKIIDGADKEHLSQFLSSLEPGKVLQNIVHSLESINEEKRACGMALGQIVADLQFSLIISTDESKSKDGVPKKLKFDCNSKMFIDIVNFYENDSEDWDEKVPTIHQKDFAEGSHQIEVLDSDDDDNPTEHGDEHDDDDEFPILGENTVGTSEIAIDPRILTLRARKRKIPMYFSEIVETLLEKAKNEDEAEILQCIVVLKIPVLLFAGVRIDSKMATTISRCLADLEDGTCLEVPILLGLYELFMQHPFEVADVLGGVTFNGDKYALGQRLMNLTRLTKIVQLSSKQSCYNCFVDLLSKHQKELCGIYPEFVEKYLTSRLKLRLCQDCRSSGRVITVNIVNNQDDMHSPNLKQLQDENEPLTWRQIVDRRVAAKTRYFVTPRSKTVVTVPDEYSTKLLPILWSSIANRLTSKTAFYLDKNERRKSGNMHDMFLVKNFQYLVRCVLGTSGPNCPHIRNMSSHAGELVSNFATHEDALVRRAVLSLLGVTLSAGEGKVFVLEALSSQGNILETVDKLANAEEDGENCKFLSHIQQCLASYTTVGLPKGLALE